MFTKHPLDGRKRSLSHPSMSVFLFLFHLRKSFVCCLTSPFLVLLFLVETTEFLFTLMTGLILSSFRNPKFIIGVIGPVSQNRFDFFAMMMTGVFRTCLTSFFIIIPSWTFSSVTSKARISPVFVFTATWILR